MNPTRSFAFAGLATIALLQGACSSGSPSGRRADASGQADGPTLTPAATETAMTDPTTDRFETATFAVG